MRKIVFCLFLVVSLGAFGKSPKPFYFVQITDPQFGMIDSDKSFFEETKLMGKAVEAINKLNPKFVVVTGDLANDRNNKAEIAEFKRMCGLINKKIPVYLTPGNHDIGQQCTDEGVNNYIKEYGYDRFAFKMNDCYFVGINTSIIFAKNEKFEQPQLAWLEKTLKKAKSSRHIILFGHHPMFTKTADEKDDYHNFPSSSRQMYLDLFKKNNVNQMFAGHLHHNLEAHSGSFNLKVTSAVGMQIGNDKSGIRVVKVYPDRIESDYYSFDQIPSEITF